MSSADGRFAAQLYGPGIVSAGEAVMGVFEGEQLRVQGRQAHLASVRDIVVTVGGFDHDNLNLSWQTSAGTFGLIPDNAEAKATLIRTAPQALTPQLQKYRRKVGGLNAKLLLLMATAALVVLGLGTLWWQYDQAVAWMAQQVPKSTETRIGEAALAQLQRSESIEQDSPAAQVVADIGNRLTAGSNYDYRWYVDDTDEVNAFALPGGIIVVQKGLLLEADSAEQLAGVLAHEIQHIELQHTLQSMINSAGWAGVLAVTLGDVSALVGILIHQAGAMHFGRELETQADIAGVDALHEADINPTGLSSFFQSLADDNLGQEIAFLSTHPSSQDRIDTIQQEIATLPAREYPPLPYDWDALSKQFSVSRTADTNAEVTGVE